MPTVPSHAVSSLAILAAFRRDRAPASLGCVGAVCAMLPDVDVIGFRLGIRYGGMLGHRGLTHSIAFAAAVATVIVLTGAFPTFGRARIWMYLFLCTISHGVLDAATNGGLGIAFFSPFSNARYFWPWRPIEVSPIGLSRLLSRRTTTVMLSELKWVWGPSLAVIAASCIRRRAGRVRAAQPVPVEEASSAGRAAAHDRISN